LSSAERARSGLRRIEVTDFDFSDQARDYVAARGGTLFCACDTIDAAPVGWPFSTPSRARTETATGMKRWTGRIPKFVSCLGSVPPTNVNVEVR